MKISKRFGQLALASLVVIVPVFPALGAGTCSLPKASVAAGNRVFAISCQEFGSTASSAECGITVSGGTTTLLVNFLSGLGSKSALTVGIDAAGNNIAGCSILDTAPGGGNKTKVCNAAVRWQGLMTY